MNYIFDKVKIEQAISDFYISTGIAIALYDATETLVAAEPGYTGFCTCIRQRSECAENCDKSNLRQMLLSQKGRNVTDISGICGFSDYNYFIRIFKKRIGSTPLQFRKQHFSKEQLVD